MSNDFFKPKIKENYPEIYEEMEGIARGSQQSIDFIVLWNCFVSLEYLYGSLNQVLKSRNSPDSPELIEKYEKLLGIDVGAEEKGVGTGKKEGGSGGGSWKGAQYV
jgi:hypothetical protein